MVFCQVKMEVNSPTNFEWLRQLRYYWEMDIDDCCVRCAGSQYIYGYEYLGACPRLVITPLTDRCYLCLMGALQVNILNLISARSGCFCYFYIKVDFFQYFLSSISVVLRLDLQGQEKQRRPRIWRKLWLNNVLCLTVRKALTLKLWVDFLGMTIFLFLIR